MTHMEKIGLGTFRRKIQLRDGEWLTGYKVVARDHNDRRWSAVVGGIGRPKVRYLMGRLILRPKPHGALAVFNTFDAALRFAIRYIDRQWGALANQYKIKDYEIYEVKYQHAERPYIWFITPKKGIRLDMDMFNAPGGTRTADAIKMGRKPVWSYMAYIQPLLKDIIKP